MKRSAMLLAALLAAGCDGMDRRGLAVMLDEDYRAEIAGSSRDGFAAPDGLLWQDGTLYMADEGGRAVRAWRPGSPATTLAEGGGLSSPEDLVRGPDGHLYVSDDDSGGMWRIEAGKAPVHIAGPGRGPRSTEAIGLLPSGEFLLGDQHGRQIVRIGADGAVAAFLGADAGIAKPESFAFDAAGNLYIADNQEDVLYVRSAEGRLTAPIKGRANFSPESLHFENGALFITDSRNGAVHRYSPEDGLRTIAVFGGELANVQGITGDGNGNLYLSVQTDLKGRRGYILRLRRLSAPAVRVAKISG